MDTAFNIGDVEKQLDSTNEHIGTLNTQLTISNGSTTNLNGNFSGTISYAKVANVIDVDIISYIANSSVTANTQYTIATLPSGYRPTKYAVHGTINVYNETNIASLPSMLTIDTDGSIRVRTPSTLPTGTYCYFTGHCTFV